MVHVQAWGRYNLKNDCCKRLSSDVVNTELVQLDIHHPMLCGLDQRDFRTRLLQQCATKLKSRYLPKPSRVFEDNLNVTTISRTTCVSFAALELGLVLQPRLLTANTIFTAKSVCKSSTQHDTLKVAPASTEGYLSSQKTTERCTITTNVHIAAAILQSF